MKASPGISRTLGLVGMVLVLSVPSVWADPEKAAATLTSRGENTEARLVVCSKCGELKGTEPCCKPGADRRSMCGLIKGSPGCCRPGVSPKHKSD